MAPTRRLRTRISLENNKIADNDISTKSCDLDKTIKMVQMKKEDDQECMLCKHKDLDEVQYGPMYKLGDVVVHYFCILLSTLARQHGADHEGIWGFLVKDIKTELKRGAKVVCCYCKKNGASIQCCYHECRKIFHLPCGLKNGSLHQFFSKFGSYCQQHRTVQRVDMDVLSNIKNSVKCVICTEDVVPSPSLNSLWAPCCKTAWFHRKCIQQMALNSGYFFKCPLCNNVETFRSKMLTLGIYIPSRDASWELVPNAFAELLERPNLCSASTCLCSEKNKEKKYENDDASDNFTKKTNEKENELQTLVICNSCGSVAIHVLCGGLVNEEDTWNCKSCKDFLIAKSFITTKRKLELTHDETTSSQTHALTSVVNTRNSAKLSLSEFRRIRASTSGLSNRHVETTSNLHKRQAQASTSRSNNENAKTTSTLPTKVTQLSAYGLPSIQEQDSISRLSNGYADNVVLTQPTQSSNELTRKSLGPTNGLHNIQERVSNLLPSNPAQTSTRGLRDRQHYACTSESFSTKLQASSTEPSNERAEVSNEQASSVSRSKNRSSTNEPSVSLQSSSSCAYNLRRTVLRSNNSPANVVNLNKTIGHNSQLNNENLFYQDQESSGVITISDSDSDDDLQITGFIPHPDILYPRPHSPQIRIESVMSINSSGNSSCFQFTTSSFIIDNLDLTLDDD